MKLHEITAAPDTPLLYELIKQRLDAGKGVHCDVDGEQGDIEGDITLINIASDVQEDGEDFREVVITVRPPGYVNGFLIHVPVQLFDSDYTLKTINGLVTLVNA